MTDIDNYRTDAHKYERVIRRRWRLLIGVVVTMALTFFVFQQVVIIRQEARNTYLVGEIDRVNTYNVELQNEIVDVTGQHPTTVEPPETPATPDAEIESPLPVAGRDGLDGETGAPGPPGADATPEMVDAVLRAMCDGSCEGAPGAPGSPGADGSDGSDGSDGLNGTNGEPGAPGVNGVDGRGIAALSCDGSTWTVTYTDGTSAGAGPCVAAPVATTPPEPVPAG